MTRTERIGLDGWPCLAFFLTRGTAAIGIRRTSFAALLEPAEGKTFRLLGQAFYIIDGHPGVLVTRYNRKWFVWKTRLVEATPELLAQLTHFSADLSAQLPPGS